MAIGVINNTTVQQVNFDGGIDNVTRIDLKKNGVTTTVWNKLISATLSVRLKACYDWRAKTGMTFGRSNGMGFPLGTQGYCAGTGRFTSYHPPYRQSSAIGTTYPAPMLLTGGYGYKVGSDYTVTLPEEIANLQVDGGNRGTRRVVNGGLLGGSANGTRRSFTIRVTSITNASGNSSATGAVGSIRSIYVNNGTGGSTTWRNELLVGHYFFLNSSNQKLSDLNLGNYRSGSNGRAGDGSDSFSVTGTVALPSP